MKRILLAALAIALIIFLNVNHDKKLYNEGYEAGLAKGCETTKKELDECRLNYLNIVAKESGLIFKSKQQ